MGCGVVINYADEYFVSIFEVGQYNARGRYLAKFNTGRLRPKVQPLTLLYTILVVKVPLLDIYHLLKKGTPFTYLVLFSFSCSVNK